MGNKKRSLVIVTVLAIGIGALVWSNWDRIAVLLAPRKKAATSRSEAAIKADDLFWQTFHNGEYEKNAVRREEFRGWVPENGPFEIPNDPCYTFCDPTGVRLAIYENQRPEVNREFAGRIDTRN